MQAERIYLAKDYSVSTDANITGLNNNVACIGGSGTGKTLSYNYPRIMGTENTSLICTGSKRADIKALIEFCKQKDFDVYDIDFTNPRMSLHSYDLMKNVNTAEDISQLSKAVIEGAHGRTENQKDRYWNLSSIDLFNAIIGLTIIKNNMATIADVLDTFDTLKPGRSDIGMSTALDSEFEALSECDDEIAQFACSCWNAFKINATNTAACIYSTLNTTLSNLFTPELRAFVKTGKCFDITKIAHKKSVVFITVPAFEEQSHKYVNIMYSQILNQLFEYSQCFPDEALPLSVHLICDDFASATQISNLEKYVSIIRSANISISILLQSESQLKMIYGEENATTILNNMDTQIYLGGMDLQTAKNMSVKLNLPVEDVLYMPIGKEFIIRRGIRPIETQRYETLDSEQYKRLMEIKEEMSVGKALRNTER